MGSIYPHCLLLLIFNTLYTSQQKNMLQNLHIPTKTSTFAHVKTTIVFALSFMASPFFRRDGRVVDCGGLENR